jgi:DNA-binding NarL/FixJ family response regulator
MNATSGMDRDLEVATRVLVSCDADVAEAPIELVTTDTELDEAEQRMLTLTAYGLSNAEIAQATSYSRQAVGWHLSKLMRAWKAPNRTALVAVAFVKGVIVAKVAKPSAPRAIQASTPPPPPSGSGS